MNNLKRILIIRSSGFIGFHLAKYLIDQGYFVVRLDNINDYYNVNLKYDQLQGLGIKRSSCLQVRPCFN